MGKESKFSKARKHSAKLRSEGLQLPMVKLRNLFQHIFAAAGKADHYLAVVTC